MIEETVWLGDLPVAILKPGVVYFVSPDHLGAPLTVTDSSGTIVWRWDRDPFGNGAPNENPGGAGTFTYNLRFPGQYYDQETGLHYNYFRDYNPKTGRYVQADPIGLINSNDNLYAYVNNNPLNYLDRFGDNPVVGLLVGGFFGGSFDALGAIIGTAIGTSAGWWIIESRAHNDPYSLPIVNPGKDCNGNCNQCPSDSPVWEHVHKDGSTNRHKIVYEQNPITCACYPRRVHL